MLTLVLTRHGLTDHSIPEQHLGQRMDVSINETGRRQAEALARRLAPVRFDRVVTSPLFRARETAEILVRDRRDVRPEADPRLREMDHGAWEGMTYAEIEARDGAYRREWERAPDQLACPGGESAADVATRLRSFLVDLLAEHRAWHARASFRAATSGVVAAREPAERRILAVGHGSANRILLCVALGTDLAGYRRRFVQGHASLTVLRWDDDDGPEDARLQLLNDLVHLRSAGEVPWG